MKSLTKLMAMGLLSVGLAACSSDDEGLAQGGNQISDADKVYVSLNLSYPQSRVAGDPAVEVGAAGENTVSSVQVLLKKGTNVVSSILSTVAPGEGQVVTPPAADTNSRRYTATFSANELLSLAGQSGIEVYAVCNGDVVPATFATDKKGLAAGDFAGLASEAYWQTDHFMMANSDAAATISIPVKDELMTKHASASQPLDLGTVKVERAAARFDYQSVKAGDAYPVAKTEELRQTAVATVNLNQVTLANISKEFYSFVHTNDGTAAEAVLGHVNPFVVDADWTWTLAGDAANNPQNSMIQYTSATPDIDAAGLDGVGCYVKYAYGNLDDITNPDNYATGTYGDYNVWTYAPENTLPNGTGSEYEKKGFATAVVFKGVIEANGVNTPDELKKAIESKDALVVYKDILLGTWADVAKIVAKTSTYKPFEESSVEFTNLVNNYNAVQAAAQPDGTIKHSTALGHGFTVYEINPATQADVYSPGKNQHEVYYYYWNKHDAKDMEYAVVRNNVYKLKVNNIKTFGYPRNGSIDPNEPIVSKDVFFEVSVDVLPWAVKVNDIEF